MTPTTKADMRTARKLLDSPALHEWSNVLGPEVENAAATAIAAALDAAREKEREACAKWHEKMANTYTAYIKEMRRNIAVPYVEASRRETELNKLISEHKRSAATIRARGK